MPEPSSLIAVCGCRYKVVARRAEGSIHGVLEREGVCLEHKFENTLVDTPEKASEVAATFMRSKETR